MINAGMLLLNAGRVRCSTAAAATTYNGGTPQTATGLFALNLNDPTAFDQGLPLVGVRVAADNTPGVVAVISQGLPYTAAGRLCTDEANAIAYHLGGLPRVASGAIACATPE